MEILYLWKYTFSRNNWAPQSDMPWAYKWFSIQSDTRQKPESHDTLIKKTPELEKRERKMYYDDIVCTHNNLPKKKC